MSEETPSPFPHASAGEFFFVKMIVEKSGASTSCEWSEPRCIALPLYFSTREEAIEFVDGLVKSAAG